jgi:hypothetical protein
MQFNQRRLGRVARITLGLGAICGAITGCATNQSQQSTSVPIQPAAKPIQPAMEPIQPAIPGQAVPPGTTLMGRLVVNPPAFHHPPVSEASVQAVRNAIKALPAPLRTKLDQSAARVIISPNMIDRWPDSVKDLPEKDPAPTLAEQPGRIYGGDMCVYERPKKRGTTALGPTRAPAFIQLQVGDMCFQLLDDMMILSKDPALRKAWNEDKEHIPPGAQARVAEFTKLDDWGPRETCAEMFGSMMGGRDENTDNLYKYFPRVKKWLIARLSISGQS